MCSIPFLDGCCLDYGTLNPGTGYYYSPVCLSAIGGLQLPATPADDGDPGTVLLGGWAVIYAQAFDPEHGRGHLCHESAADALEHAGRW
jgi:hypothetical protein